MSDSAVYMAMASTDLAQAQTIFNQVTADLQQPSAEQWVMMTSTQTKVFVIDTVAPAKPTSWVSPSLVNSTTRVPLGFPYLMALRIRWMLNNLPA